MLILTREAGQRIMLTLADGRTITVTFCQIRNGKGRIGVDAPDDVLILREELTDDGRERDRR